MAMKLLRCVWPVSVAAVAHNDDEGLYFNVEPYDGSLDPSGVSEVHVVFSNHLDIGFNSRSWNIDGPFTGCNGPNMTRDGMLCRPWAYGVIQANLDTFLPRAIEQAESLRGTDTPFSYMTQAYMVDLMLDCEASMLDDWRAPHIGEPLLKCPNASAIASFKEAVIRGDIWWHAFPHNSMVGLYDASLLNSTFRMGSSAAEAIGVQRPRTFSQRDETGLTRAAVPLLAAAGVGMISVGSGGDAGGHPVLPDIFVWRDEASDNQLLFVHDHGYGGGTHILPNGHALYCAWNQDNLGPLPPDRVKDTYAKLRAKFPNANVHTSTFDAFYDAAQEPGVLEQLPVVTQDIGDTWNYGVPTDPLKNTQFRVMSRLRRECVEVGHCDVSSATMRRFDRLLTKIPEHTWGEDTTWYLGDNENWTNVQVEAAMHLPNYEMTVDSWLEQRSYLDNALRILEKSAEEHYQNLAEKIRSELKNLVPARPMPADLRQAGFVQWNASLNAPEFVCQGIHLAFGQDGGLKRLERDGTSWASEEKSLATFTYQTMSADDFVAFDSDFMNQRCLPNSTSPMCHNFMKPNMYLAKPEHQEVAAKLVDVWYHPEGRDLAGHPLEACEFRVHATMPLMGSPGLVHEYYGAPDTVWTSVTVEVTDEDSFTTHFDVQVFNKTRTRLAEASWVSFQPTLRNTASGWRLRGFASGFADEPEVDPTDVVAHGGTHLHTLGPLGYALYSGPEGTVSLSSPDVPILSTGLMTPFPTPGDNTTLPENMEGGMHFNLQNNIWNTNFPQWYPFVEEDKDARYRFVMTVHSKESATPMFV